MIRNTLIENADSTMLGLSIWRNGFFSAALEVDALGAGLDERAVAGR